MDLFDVISIVIERFLIISMVETTPTFQRTKTVLESIQSKAIAEEEETFNNDAENGGITITF